MTQYITRYKKAVVNRKATNIERLMERALIDMEIRYEPEVKIGPYRVDFLLRDSNVIIECDGAYWHNNILQKSKDGRRDKYLRACGYQVYRAAEWAIKENAKACVRTAMRLNALP